MLADMKCTILNNENVTECTRSGQSGSGSGHRDLTRNSEVNVDFIEHWTIYKGEGGES